MQQSNATPSYHHHKTLSLGGEQALALVAPPKQVERVKPRGNEDKGNNVGMVVIRVCDEVRNVTKNFECEKTQLLNSMTYFRTFFKKPTDKVDISVHCDVNVFEWLMKFVHRPESAPKFSIRSIVSILISSDFLGMETLAASALEYTYKHMESVLALPFGLNCINDDLLERLARMYKDTELDELIDPKDKIRSKLFRKKVERLVEENPGVTRCERCRTIYDHQKHSSLLTCDKVKPTVDFHGEIDASHRPDKNWDLVDSFIARKRLARNSSDTDDRGTSRESWRNIYWKVWSFTKIAHCKTCRAWFTLPRYHHCIVHPRNFPVFGANSGTGMYPCCGAKVHRFPLLAVAPTGCISARHIPEQPSTLSLEEWSTFVQREEIIVEPPPKHLTRASSSQSVKSAESVSSAESKKGKKAESSRPYRIERSTRELGEEETNNSHRISISIGESLREEDDHIFRTFIANNRTFRPTSPVQAT